MKLTINVATRNRPQMATEVLQSMLDNIEQPDTTIMAAVDDDDTETIAAVKRMKGVLLSVAPRPDTVAEKWNRATTEAPADVYLAAVDCRDIKTKGFDTQIIEAAKLFPDGIGCVYFPMENASFPALQAPTAGLVEKMGYIYPPYFPFWFVDHWLDDICRMIDRIAVVNVQSQAKPHQTRGLRDLTFWTTFFDAGQLHRRALAHSIVDSDDFLDDPWRKEMIKSRHSMVETYSMHINHYCRSGAADIEGRVGGLESEFDARYTRIIERAKGMLYRVVEDEAA